jgi:hypothetical protein
MQVLANSRTLIFRSIFDIDFVYDFGHGSRLTHIKRVRGDAVKSIRGNASYTRVITITLVWGVLP